MKRGLQFEERVAVAVGGSTIAGSGASWRSKSDVRGKLRISAKAEATKSWNCLKEQLREAIDFSFGTGEFPALAVLDDDESAYIVMRLEDFSHMLSDNVKLQPVESRGDRIRQVSDTPSLLR
jgi:hypothetical protein